MNLCGMRRGYSRPEGRRAVQAFAITMERKVGRLHERVRRSENAVALNTYYLRVALGLRSRGR